MPRARSRAYEIRMLELRRRRRRGVTLRYNYGASKRPTKTKTIYLGGE